MSKQARQGSFAARAPSSVGVSRDLLSALLRREVYLPLLGEGNLPGASCMLTSPRHPSAALPGHIYRALPGSGPFIPLLAESLFSFESVAFPVLYVLAQKHSASSKLCNNKDLTICWC